MSSREISHSQLTTDDAQRFYSRVAEIVSIGRNGFAANFVRPSGAISDHVHRVLHVDVIGELKDNHNKS